MLPTVCLAYAQAKEERLLQLSLRIMSAYDWVTRIVVLDTDHDAPPVTEGKLTRQGQNFGYGIQAPPDAGGYDQISARNRLLTLARATGCDWIVICDADEYYTPAIYQEIVSANTSGVSVLRVAIMNYCDIDKVVLQPRFDQLVDGQLWRVTSPRAIRACCDTLQYVPCQQADLLAGNPTQHCFIDDTVLPREQVRYRPQLRCWVHLRYLLGDKTDVRYVDSLARHPADPAIIHPEVLLALAARQQDRQKGLSSNI